MPSNWQKMSTAHPLLIKCLIDPPYLVDNEEKRKEEGKKGRKNERTKEQKNERKKEKSLLF